MRLLPGSFTQKFRNARHQQEREHGAEEEARRETAWRSIGPDPGEWKHYIQHEWKRHPDDNGSAGRRAYEFLKGPPMKQRASKESEINSRTPLADRPGILPQSERSFRKLMANGSEHQIDEPGRGRATLGPADRGRQDQSTDQPPQRDEKKPRQVGAHQTHERYQSHVTWFCVSARSGCAIITKRLDNASVALLRLAGIARGTPTKPRNFFCRLASLLHRQSSMVRTARFGVNSECLSTILC